jgi:L-rhamnose mutarotase
MELPDIVRKDVLRVLKKVKEALSDRDTATIKELSNHTIHNASIFQDGFSTTVATTVYSLAKIVENKSLHEEHPQEWERFISKINSLLDSLIACAESEGCEKMEELFQQLVKTIATFDERFTEYVGFVLEKAKIKKGVEMHRHGVSLSRVSEILGISLWDLMSYAGKTKVTEDIGEGEVMKRFKKARGLFQ